MNFTGKSKRNPWRNTRDDYMVPWDKIKAFIFMLLVPLSGISVTLNINYRSPQFYNFFFTRSDIARDIPYRADGRAFSDFYCHFMQHRIGQFQLQEASGYKPQNIFNENDIEVMRDLRIALDILLILGIIGIIIACVIFLNLYRDGNKELLCSRFDDGLILMTLTLGLLTVIAFLDPLRQYIFRKIFGSNFPPGDVMIQIFEGGLWKYGAIGVCIVSVIMMGVVTYFVKKLVSRRKMFREF